MRSKEQPVPDIHLNLNVRGLSESATLAINERSRRLQHEGRDVYLLGLGQSPFPVPAPVVEELRANAHQKDYLPVKGLATLRDAVAGYHRRQVGIEYRGEDVLIGPGSKELMFLVQLVYYGNLVIPTPSWVSYAPQATIIGRHIHWMPTSIDQGWRLSAQALEELCKTDPTRPRIVILNYPNNPSGTSYSDQELKAIGRVARRYRVILLSDEIYGELNYTGQHTSIATYYPEGTIISSGLSKWCGAGGWRLGTFTFPTSLRWLLDAVAVVASETFTSTSAPIQHAAIRAFYGGIQIERYLFNSRRILKAIAEMIVSKLRVIGVDAPEPQGGFYVFPSFETFRRKFQKAGMQTSTEFCERLLESTGVAVLPGTSFGRSPEEFTARIAFVDFDGARALVAAEAIPPAEALPSEFVERYCSRVSGAIDRMCEWIVGL